MVESDTPKKKKIQEQIDVQMAREMKEQMAREDQRMNEHIARDAEIARNHHTKILKYQAQQSKPLSKKQQREFYMSVLKIHLGWKTKHFKGIALEEIRKKFIPIWKQIEDFVPMSSTEEGKRMKRKGLRLEQGSAKKMKTSEEVFEEDLKEMMQLVPVEEVYVEALQVIPNKGGMTVVKNEKDELIPQWMVTGNKYILVAIDYVSKWVEAQAFPTSDARNAVSFLRRLFARSGIPKALISDRGILGHKNCNMDLTNARENHFLQINELDKMRLDAYESSISYKERIKRWHDKRIKLPINYEKGDKVLPFNSRLRLFLRKLMSRWYGPFSVSKDMKNKAIKLYNEEGSEFIINKQRAKPYQKNLLDTNKDDDITLEDEGEVTLPKLVSQLVLLEEKLSQEDVNQKLLRSLSPEWNTHVVVWRNKVNLDTMRMDDLYNNLKSDQAEEGPNYALMAFSSLIFDSKILDNCKKGLGYEKYNAVPPPYTGNFMPPTPDLSFTGLDEFVNKLVVENCKAKSNEEEPKPKIEKKTVRPSIAKIEFVKSKQQGKTARKTVKQVEQNKKNTHNPKGNQIDLNNMMSQKLESNFEMFNKACDVCGSFDHLQGTCYITDYKEIDGGYVAFGGNPKGGKITRKAFRVFNSRTKIVEENLHIRFSESTPNVVGSGPD
nr:hypothetical protein [Tanacetum cinerariifolium]